MENIFMASKAGIFATIKPLVGDESLSSPFHLTRFFHDQQKQLP